MTEKVTDMFVFYGRRLIDALLGKEGEKKMQIRAV